MAEVVSHSGALRVAVLGNSGSGKSTLAQSLGAAYALPLLDLDTVAWQPGQVAVPRDPLLAQREVDSFCTQHASWVVEGCYADLVAVTLRFAPILLLLNPGTEVCQEHCRNRPFEPHKYASKAEQDERLPFLLAWVAEYETREGPMSLRGHRQLFDAYRGPKKELTSRVSATDKSTLLQSL